MSLYDDDRRQEEDMRSAAHPSVKIIRTRIPCVNFVLECDNEFGLEHRSSTDSSIFAINRKTWKTENVKATYSTSDSFIDSKQSHNDEVSRSEYEDNQPGGRRAKQYLRRPRAMSVNDVSAIQPYKVKKTRPKRRKKKDTMSTPVP